MKDYCILGSGIAGSTIASLLAKKYSVEVFEKSRGPGGRTSNRRYTENLNFDHGAQYISPKSKKFTTFIEDLKKKKVLKIWNGNHLDFKFKIKKDNEIKYIGKRGNNDICKFLLKKIKARYSSSIKKVIFKNNNWNIHINEGEILQFKNLILSCPFPQTKILVKKYLNKKISNLDIRMEPNITVMVAYKNNLNLPLSSIKFNDEILSWASNENSKNRYNSKLNLWTLQASEKWSKKAINKYKEKKSFFINKIVNQFFKLTGFKKDKIIFSQIHGWKYSYNLKKTNYKSFWIKKYKLGICGDWLSGPKIENAWLSANDLYLKKDND